MVLLKVDGIITRALIDTGARSLHISTKVGDMLNKKSCKISTKRVEMLMGSHLTKLETYNITIQSLDNTFKMDTKLTKVSKSELLAIDNPHYHRESKVFTPCTNKCEQQRQKGAPANSCDLERRGLCKN